METKRFRLRLLISQARLGEKPLETWRAELRAGSTASALGAPLPGTTSSPPLGSLVPEGERAPGASARGLNQLRGGGSGGARDSVCTGMVSCFPPKAGMWERGAVRAFGRGEE